MPDRAGEPGTDTDVQHVVVRLSNSQVALLVAAFTHRGASANDLTITASFYAKWLEEAQSA